MDKIKKFAEKYSIYLVLLLGAIFRLYRIDYRDLWYDEAFTGVALKENFWGMIDMIIKDVHPPLYYVTAKAFASFFNYSVFGIRLYSAVLGVFAIWAIYLLTKNLFGKKAALWSSMFAAVSPFAIQYSQEARMYTMFGLLFIFASHFLFRGFQTGKTKYYLLFGLFLGLSSLTHYMGIITFPIFFVIFWGWKIFQNKMLEIKFSFSKLREFLPSKKLLEGYGIFALVFSFWIPIFYRHLFKVGTLVWIKPATLGDVFTNIQIFILGSPLGEKTGGSTGVPIPNEIYGIATGSIIVFIAIFLTAITVYLFKKEEKKEKVISVLILSVGYLFLVYVLSLLGGHYLISRYLSPSAYFLYILLGLWISRIRFSYAVPSFVIYLMILGSIVPIQNSTGWKGMKDNAGKYEGKNFYILNPFDYVIARYYLGPEKIVLYNLDNPDYVAENWAAIGPNARSVKKFEDIRNDKKNLILSNTIIGDQVMGDYGIIHRENLNSSGLQNIDNYENISIYQFR